MEIMPEDRIMKAALRKRPEHELKSPVFQFLWGRYEAYGDQLKERGVDWDHIAATLAAEGIFDGRGQAPTGKTVRATFYRVRKIKDGDRPKRRPIKPKPQSRRSFGVAA